MVLSDVSEKIDLLKQAVRIYKGNVLTSAEAEHWLMLTASHYNLKYVGIVNELLRMLADAECYHDLHKYAAQSLSIEPGNIYAYYWLIYSMVHLGSFDLAKSEYEMAQRYLTDEEYKELTDMLRYFCDEMSARGFDPMVYFNWTQSSRMLYLSELEDVPFWLALYQDRMTYPFRVEMWQYTNQGTVPGINGDVDINLYIPDLTKQ